MSKLTAMTNRTKQRGAVSLFIVIFTTLLMAVITVSFVQLMTKDQKQATVSDLSRSAYDSAQAGVEDAKRLLILNQSCIEGTAVPPTNCGAVTGAVSHIPQTCDTLSQGGVSVETNHETLLQQNVDDVKLDQAYTCVKITTDTDDYLGQIASGSSVVVPLRGVSTFQKISLSWFSDKDIASTTNDLTLGYPSCGASMTLPRIGTCWKFNYPSLMRTQLIQTSNSFTLDNFDDSLAGGSNANTLFLYPTSSPSTDKDFASDARYSPTNAPQLVHCRPNLTGGGYACTVDVNLPDPIGGGAADRHAYLNLAALYNPAHFRIQLKDSSGAVVKFAGVQPEVDSTGRANDLFRRVVSRVELHSDFSYPLAALETASDLCKNFSVTTEPGDFSDSPSCPSHP